MDMAKIISTASALLVGLLMLNAFSNKKGQRHKQGLMPVVAAIYGVLATVIVILKVEDIKEAYELQKMAQYIEIWLINMIVFWGFLLVKLIFRPIVNKLSQLSIFYGLINTFYEYDADYNEWFLQERWRNIRKLFKQFIALYAGFTALFLSLTWINGEGSRYWVHITPVVLLLVVFEIYSFLESYTKVEWEHHVMGDESISERVSNFYRIRDIYERIFPGEILAANTGCEFTTQKDVISLLKQMEESDDDIEVLTSEFFSMNEGEEYYDADYIEAVVKLMKKENVIFFNPFYKDLGKYIILPFINALISDQNCLVILGRGSTKEDVRVWIEELIKDYCKFESIWRIGEINRDGQECEIGLLSFNDLYDYRVIEENKEFFDKAGFVFILEPSLVINTGQIGFSIIADQMRETGLDPVYCIADRMVDGLVDTMSHLLREKITDVIAPPVPRHIYTSMAWDADGDYMRQRLFEKQTRYLGNGFELSAVAIKNQIPEVTWISETKAPISDLKWIIGQYYTSLCRYMNLPIQQQSIYDKVKFVSNLWSVDRKKERFLVVDDEFCNMFGMMRVFMSRADQQIFVNIMSENYLLRDYMRCNSQVFTSNPNVVPSIVPDYAKTERNTILKLLLMMAYKPVSEEDIRKDLELINYPGEDVFLSLNNLVKKYTFVKEQIFSIHTEKHMDDLSGMESEFFYRVEPAIFEKYLQKSLKNAYYVVEQEDKEVEYIDAKLFGQVAQTVLPGQSVIYDGKYYTVKHLSVNSGVILRRSADIYDGRKYYRQIRKYFLDETPEERIVSHKKIMDVELSMICTDFHVETSGYLEMGTNNDLRTAREIDLQYDIAYEEMQRKYRNKNVLRIKLPETTKQQKFTMCLLLTEMFRSIFPNTWHYLAVTTARPDDVAGMLTYAVYDLQGNVDEDYIYVIEDSDMDLGLLEAIEKNFNKFMEIMSDFIVWHFEKMREPESKDPVRKSIVMPEDQKIKRGLPKLLERIAKIFGVKKEKEVKIEEPVEEAVEETPAVEEAAEETTAAEDAAAEAVAEAEDITAENPESEEAHTLDEESEEGEKSEEEKSEEILEEAAQEEAAQEETENPEGEGESTEVSVLEEEPAEETAEKAAEEAAEAETSEPASKAEIAEEAEKIVAEADESDIPETGDEEEEGFEDIFDEENKEDSDSDVVDVDGTDIFDTDSDPVHDDYFNEHFKALGIGEKNETRYQRECYLKYGFDEVDSWIELDGVRKYLNARGWSNKDLTKARTRETFIDMTLYLEAENHCDFCGMPISGVSYERVNDGRIRCNDCSASAINSADEFRKLFYHILQTMQNFYGIDYRVPIAVKMTDAKEIGRGAGMIFRPSTEYAARVLGYAQKKNNKYSLLVENGAPRLAMINTMVHEMTHIWQYLNWNDREIQRLYGNNTNRDIVYEGMAMWAAIQYLYMIGESSYAAKEEFRASRREDVYGVGFNLFCQKYPLVKDSSTIKYSPFSVFPPL